MTRLALVVSTVFYCGYAPVAPGTAGSIMGLAVFALLRRSGSAGTELAAIALLFGVGVWAATSTERHFGRHDPGEIVIDEVVGMLVTLALVPVNGLGVLAGFLLFRLFDVVKPYPARSLERLPNGWGVMADDVMAGAYAHTLLRVIVWLWPGAAA